MSHAGRLEGKVALVTGGGFGFGKGIVEKFVHEGAKCMIADINDENGKQVANEQPSGSADFVHCDVSIENDWKSATQKTIDSFGKLDIVVNNAGIVNKMEPTIEVDEQKVDDLFRVNVKSMYHSVRAYTPIFKAQGHGVVVNIGSVSADRPRPYLVWYAGTKGAVNSITKGLAAELIPLGVRVNAILPVAGETNMAPYLTLGEDSPEARAKVTAGIPMGRWAQPKDIANAACFLASDEAEFITGVCLRVDVLDGKLKVSFPCYIPNNVVPLIRQTAAHTPREMVAHIDTLHM